MASEVLKDKVGEMRRKGDNNKQIRQDEAKKQVSENKDESHTEREAGKSIDF